jgi:crotonobetainyl-CoA:carnitine CoA-transferase CaiB-like acyl-CoA transferase
LSESATWFLSCGIRPLSDRPLILPASPDRRLYTCADGRFVAVACAEPRTWHALCDQLGVPELKRNLHKGETAEATTAALVAIFGTLPASEWITRLAPAGVAVTIMNHATQLLDDPQVRARNAVAEAGDTPVPASPLRLAAPDGSQTATATGAPYSVGEDTIDVLDSAGFSAVEIETLTANGVI